MIFNRRKTFQHPLARNLDFSTSPHQCRIAARYRFATWCFLAVLLSSNAYAAVEQEIFGWVERVEIMNGRFTLKAKLDTGAATSSLDATNIQEFKRKGKRWVRFTLEDPSTGKPVELERRLIRHVRIIRHNGKHQRRAVIKINVCLGHSQRDVEVSLIDRGEFIYSILLGRSALESYALIDAGETFLSKPRCEYEITDDDQDNGDDNGDEEAEDQVINEDEDLVDGDNSN